MLDKNPYHGQFTPARRKQILIAYCDVIAKLKVRSVAVSIDKKRIQRPAYNVLEKALTYNIQRIENDLEKSNGSESFLLITDEGRVGMMRTITRRMQLYNHVPSMFFGDGGSNKVIKRLIEDPLPKASDQSYFIQIADTIAYIVLLYSRLKWSSDVSTPNSWPKRLSHVLQPEDVEPLLKILKPILNTRASTSNECGIVHYPK
jgi:hypothetical protein